MTVEGHFRGLEGRDAYEILGVPPTADRQEISRARRQRQRQMHPDLGHAAGPDGERAAKLINVAATILLDEAQRRDYDQWRQAGFEPGPPPGPVPGPSVWDAATPGFAVPTDMPRHPGAVHQADAHWPRAATPVRPTSGAPPGPAYHSPYVLPNPDMPMPAYHAPTSRRTPTGVIVLVVVAAVGTLCLLACVLTTLLPS
jgi:hypothetical protein